MKRNVLWGVALWGFGMGIGLTSTVKAADVPALDQDTQHTQFIEMSFRSLCQRPPDPASMNYYLNVLADGSRTAAEVHKDIETTCLHRAEADACRHVTGLSDVCPPPVN